jgi:hypothetical protein
VGYNNKLSQKKVKKTVKKNERRQTAFEKYSGNTTKSRKNITKKKERTFNVSGAENPKCDNENFRAKTQIKQENVCQR